MPIDSKSNSVLEYQTYFYKKFGCGIGKRSQTWKNGLKFYKNDLWHLSPQNRKKLVPNFFYWKMSRNRVGKIGYFKFWFWPFDFWSWPVSCQKIAKIVQKVIEIGPWFSDIWIALWLKLFPRNNKFFFDFGHLQGETKGGVRVGPKMQTLGISRFRKNLNFWKILRTDFFSP